MFFAALDGVISTTSCLLMCSVWMPKALKNRIQMKTEEDFSTRNSKREENASKREETTNQTQPIPEGAVVPVAGPH